MGKVFDSLDMDCIDLDAWAMENCPDIYNIVKYLSDYSAALEILAIKYVEMHKEQVQIAMMEKIMFNPIK